MRHSFRTAVVVVTTILATSVTASAAVAAPAAEARDSGATASYTQGWLCRLLKIC